uniref:ATP synthase F0 subunit 8 n=1 Tax=Krisna concava TaxID=1962554 RepID=A0A6C0MCQ4_9HEMI|nr:ATP synthase F0 subunit 8 [Krisna concava]QHV34349.1 ATP synthase F0 subunit 8 [Krisna concava]
MPQMSPMWWMTLMLIFNLNFYLMMSIMYFNKKNHFKTMKKKSMNMNWKW